MRWLKPGIRNSISALLSGDARTCSPEALEPARLAMLAILGKEGAELNPHLHHRLMYMADAEALWYARSDMVAVLSALHGEVHAVNMVHELTPLFKGLVSKSLLGASRASAPN